MPLTIFVWTSRFVLGAACAAVFALNAGGFVGGWFNERLDLITHATPVLFVAGLVCSLMFAAVAGRRAGLFALILAAAPPASVMAIEQIAGFHRPATAGAGRLKIVSINLWSQNTDPMAIEALIAREQPDVILLQEASAKRHRELLRSLARAYPSHAFVNRHCSTRVLSRFVLLETFANDDCTLTGGRFRLPVALGGGDLIAASVHLPRPYLPGASRQSALVQAEMARFAGESAIVGGDFNRTPWSNALRRFDAIAGLERRSRAIATWPSPHHNTLGRFEPPIRLLPIDHVYATGDWITADARAGEDVGSDHAPVVIELARRVARPSHAATPER